MNIAFRRNLGFIFDACHVMSCKVAKRDSWIGVFVRNGSETKDIKELDSILERFEMVNHKMLLLAQRKMKKGCLIGNILIEYADEYIGEWEVGQFTQYLLNCERMKKYVTEFYFDCETTDNIFEKIAYNVDLSSEVKSLLYEFYIFTDRYMEMVKSEMEKIFLELQKFYSEKFEQLLQRQETFDYSILKQENSPFAKNKRWDQGVKMCYTSFSLINKYAIVRGKNKNTGWLILGSNFFATFGEMSEVKLDIAAFGNAFGDKIRVGIIDEIVKNGELTLADLSRKLGVVNTIVVYHLDILKKENLLLHRYQGRKVLYCLNISQIEKGLEAIKSLCGGVDK